MGDIQDDELQIYSQEEINQAREELKSLTPEDYLTMKEDLDRAIANQSMPEAVAIAFTEIYSSKGNKINVTCRGMSGRHAIDELADALRYAREKYGMHVANSTPPVKETEPAYVQDEATVPQESAGEKIVEIDVTGITRERKRDGKGDFIRARGGQFTKYGVPAYDNVFPKNLNVSAMSYGVEVPPIAGMEHARVHAEIDKDGRMSKAKVIAFF